MPDTPADAWLDWSPAEVKKYKVAIYRLTNGSYEGFCAGALIPPGAERLAPQPKRPTSGDPYGGTKAAMKKLEMDHPLEIAWGRHIAVLIAREKMTVHTREIRDRMEALGLLGPDTGREYWLGAVVRGLKDAGILKETGHRYKYSDAQRGIHEREIKIWALVDGAPLTPYLEEPPRKS